MKRTLTRLAAFTLAGTMLLGMTAFADNVIVAASPTANNAATVQGSSTVTQQGTSTWVGDQEHVISSTGPTGSKVLDSKGVLVIGKTGPADQSLVGPGGGSTTSTATQGTNTTTSQTAAAPTQAAVSTTITKPGISAGGAVLYDATTNQILFEKNGDTALAPASTTKLMTALLAVERLKLTDTLTAKASAVTNLESGATTAGLSAGDTITVNDALHAILIKSACEVANVLGEAISGSEAEFAALMNQRAKELGCTNTNFANASGLNSDAQHTTARDMALIAKAALSNETIKAISQKRSYTLPATASRASLAIATTNKFVSGAYTTAGFAGGKTGYTSKAGSCLVTKAVRNNHELIAVVLKESAPAQYTDTQALLDYGAKVIDPNAAQTATQQTAQTQSASGSWEKTASGQWKFKKADGSYYTNEWLDYNGNTYFFDGSSIMCTGWKQFTNKSWYYFNPENGAMVKGKWVAQNGKSYYLQKDGVMAVNTVIDGMYQVDENGVYVKKVG